MDPISAAIMGIPAIAGGVMNMFGQQGQQQMSARALQLQQMMAERQYQLQTAGQSDARGNRVEYVPGYGWKTITTPGTAALLQNEDREKNQQFTQDAPLRREGLQRSALQGRALEQPTSAAIARLSGPRTDPKALAGMIAQQSGQAAARGYDDVANAVGRTAVRTGNTSNTRTMERLADARGKGVQDAILDGIIKGRTVGENVRSSEDQRLGNDVARLISGQPSVQPFMSVPNTEPGVSPMGAAGAAGKFDPTSGLAASNRLIPGASANPWSQIGDFGVLGNEIYRGLSNKDKKPSTGYDASGNGYKL